MRRCGLTILEVLIALVLLLALGAIIFPAFSYRYHRVVFDTCVGQIQSVINYARAEAQYRGEILAVVWEREPGLLRVVAFNTGMATNNIYGNDDNDVGASRFEDNQVIINNNWNTDTSNGDNSGFVDLKSLSWTRYELPDRLVLQYTSVGTANGSSNNSIVDEYMTGDSGFDEIANEGDDTGSIDWGGGNDAQSTMQLVILLPDGSALCEQPFELTDNQGGQGGRVAQFEINRWTGSVEVSISAQEEDGIRSNTSDNNDESGYVSNNNNSSFAGDSNRDK